MFTGHYGVAFAVKGAEPRLRLWALFLAAQLVDIAWTVFVVFGVEHVRIVPGFTRSSPLEFTYYPYTHSLLAGLVWGAAVATAYRTTRGPGASRPALLLGLTVASHWFLDLLVHVPDLPLYDNTAKMGLGLWNLPLPAFLVEAAVLLGGLWFYLRRSQPVRPRDRYALPIFAVVMLGVQSSAFFGPPPPSVAALGVTGFGLYVLLAAVAGWLERGRR